MECETAEAGAMISVCKHQDLPLACIANCSHESEQCSLCARVREADGVD